LEVRPVVYLLTNLGSEPAAVGVDLTELGVELGATCAVQELWADKVMPNTTGSFTAQLQPHASRLVRLSGCVTRPVVLVVDAQHRLLPDGGGNPGRSHSRRSVADISQFSSDDVTHYRSVADGNVSQFSSP
jgi:hypothetical protein